MEKDLKILEENINNGTIYCLCGNTINKAIENLIKRNKYLEEKAKTTIAVVGANYIHKDKIREKIEEYRYLMQNPKEAEHYVAWYGRRIDILEELLQEGDDKEDGKI